MKTVRITRAQAVQIVGSEVDLRERIAQDPDSELALLYTYAKLYRDRRGRYIRYVVSGYAADGSDVDQVLDDLKAGKRRLLAGLRILAA